jgi:hypothetical protein
VNIDFISEWPSIIGHEKRSAAVRSKEALLIAVLCVVAAVMICAATIYLILHAIWPSLAPTRVRGWRSTRRRRSGEIAARALLARPIRERKPLEPPQTKKGAALAPSHAGTKRKAKRRVARRR